MKILIGCEFSGIVRDAFLKKGHNVISCDILPSASPGPHYTGDIFNMLKEKWDLIIVHPPCTAIAVSGNRHYATGKRYFTARLAAVKWTEKLWFKCITQARIGVCLENPVGVLNRFTSMPKPQYIQPYQFGHTEQKKTGLFLHRLAPLRETKNVYLDMMKLPKKDREAIFYMPPSDNRRRKRSITYSGIADAMADQWG